MRRRLGGLLAGVVLGLAWTPAFGGTYLQSQGDLNYSTSLGFLTSDKDWDADGKLVDAGCRSDYSFLSQYFEYGWSYYHTLYGGVNLAHAKCGPNSKTGPGDVTAGIRGRIDPARNYRAWEIEVNIPTDRQTTGATRLGCGAFAVRAGAGTEERVSPLLDLGVEGGIQFWESPLEHQVDLTLNANGPIGTRRSPWKWKTELDGYTPLDGSAKAVGSAISDCGTAGTLVRTNLGIGYVPSVNNYFSCTATAGVWGLDSTRRLGIYCGFSHLFKR